MNPAIVAAALNQWGLLNGMQPNQGNNNDQVSLKTCYFLLRIDCHPSSSLFLYLFLMNILKSTRVLIIITRVTAFYRG